MDCVGYKREQLRFYNSCVKRLEEVGLPIAGWRCFGVEDMLEVATRGKGGGTLVNCDLCGANVRYLHYMEHPDSAETIAVGRFCAGMLEGDELAAIQREQEIRRRSMRKSRFMKRKWRNFHGDPSIVTCKHRGKVIVIQTVTATINPTVPAVGRYGYKAYVDGEAVERAVGSDNGRIFSSFLSAVAEAFEKADPPIFEE